MFRLSRLIAIAAVSVVLLAPGTAAATSEEAEPTVSLRWALGALETDAAAPNSIQRDTQLTTGTRLKFLVEPLSAGTVYLILLDSDDEISVLYRQPSVRSTDGSEPTYIPPGSQWFELDSRAGMETFFLLASVEPLPDLQALIDKHDAADAAVKKTLGTDIVAEIRRLHKQHRNFARPVEKPVIIGGQTRGENDDPTAAIDRLAVEVSAENFYGKTITIDH